MKFISTSGHGYLVVTKNQLAKATALGVEFSKYSFYNEKVALLEEDVDAGKYLMTMFPDGGEKLNIVYQNDINRNCYERF